MVKSRSQASTWLRGDFLRVDSVHITTCIQPTTPPGPPLAANAAIRRTLWPGPPRDRPHASPAPLARATPRSVARALARATPRKWPGLSPLLTTGGTRAPPASSHREKALDLQHRTANSSGEGAGGTERKATPARSLQRSRTAAGTRQVPEADARNGRDTCCTLTAETAGTAHLKPCLVLWSRT